MNNARVLRQLAIATLALALLTACGEDPGKRDYGRARATGIDGSLARPTRGHAGGGSPGASLGYRAGAHL